ncbi:phenylacetic acid degradation protein [Mycolicibacterium parafortuitum]|uniref:Phenylacetic acid degradation protein n=1 Tax=Mycolicibacterium parafortuitum TaxID=39692 RepID=A0A7I7U057_MYCPF|nr:PaaI family thioesterase [Mycolicibacterium parafortuitum]BBY74792.1 phenylacetic acid degradation protein [Mycolicibacterium parafortuitum]
MPYPLNTPLGRFGIETFEESADRCVASIPVAGFRNPVTGAPTIAPMAMLVDHIGGLINHARRGPDQWTVSSELSLEVAPDTAEAIAAADDATVVGVAHPLGGQGICALGACELAIGGRIVATATVRSFYITVPATLASWPTEPGGSLPGPRLCDLMAVSVGETGGAATVLVQGDDPVLNNSVGAVHGGVSSMGFELVGSAAVNRDQSEPGYRTASLRVNFLRPFHGGGEAHYRARHSHLGRSSGVAEAEAVGRDGRVALIARLTAYR